MTKNKIKLTLIDDYIKICLIKNFLNNDFNQAKLTPFYLNLISKLKHLNSTLEQIYCKIFEKLKLNNTSLDVLKRDLLNNNIQFEKEHLNNYLNCAKTIDKSNLLLNSILNNLKQKLKVLKLDVSCLTM